MTEAPPEARLLQTENLHAGYGHVEVLRGITMHVNRGEFVAIVGANGAGKTTFLRTISGVNRAWSGTVSFAGQPLNGLAAAKIPALGIAHVPEGRQVFPQLSVRENLLVGAYVNHSEAARRDQLELVYDLFPRLKERAGQMAGTMSGGEQQMLALGRALMSAPTLLMLDEPSQGLAPKVVGEMYEKLGEIYQRGTTILLVEQNVTAAFRYASRAYVFERGRVAIEGASAELAKNDEVRRAYLGV